MTHPVRLATAADLPGLAAVEASGDRLFDTLFDDVDWPPPESGEARAAHPGFLLVVGEPVVGFAHVLRLPEGWHLKRPVGGCPRRRGHLMARRCRMAPTTPAPPVRTAP